MYAVSSFEQIPINDRPALHAEVPYRTIPPAIATTGRSFTVALLNIKSDFASIARKYGVDEATIGNHELVIKQYIQPPQDSPLRVLELGMRCRRTPTIRSLYRAWQEYLPQTSERYAIENNSVCTDLVARPQDHFDPEAFDNLVYIWEAMAPARVPSRDGSYHGVEADKLEEEFEIIIDSGFHAFEYQIQVLKAFWKQVAPGGIYVLMPTTPLTSKYLHTLLTNLVSTPPERSISSELKSIDCGERLCILTKNTMDGLFEFSYSGLVWE